MSVRIKCPVCRKEIIYLKQNTFRPFCSERCRLVDLGLWLDEGYCIPDEDSLVADNTEE